MDFLFLFLFLFLLSVCGVFIIFTLFILIRNEIVYRVRLRAIEVDHDMYLNGDDYSSQLYSWRKWTFKQFYPELK